jgi:hypothetical protein
MKAIELKKRFLKDDKLKDAGVIAIRTTGAQSDKKEREGYWWHVHDDEEIPSENNYTIALHPRNVSY